MSVSSAMRCKRSIHSERSCKIDWTKSATFGSIEQFDAADLLRGPGFLSQLRLGGAKESNGSYSQFLEPQALLDLIWRRKIILA